MEIVPYVRTELENMIDWMNVIHNMEMEERLRDLGTEVVETVPAIDSLPWYVKEALIGFLHDLGDAEVGFCRLLSALEQMRTEELNKSKHTLTVYDGFRGDLREVKTYNDELSYADDCVSYEEDPRYVVDTRGRHTTVWLRNQSCEEDE